MRTAETILNIIQDRGKRALPLDDVYRQLYNPDMYLRAYAKLQGNEGAMTPGTMGETVDGMSLEKINRVIESLRYERWQWPPSRRVYIDKAKGGKRPLGMPDWSAKVVQDIMRSMLEAYYEPQFSANSHGFRPHRGCHSALIHIDKNWKGTKWFIEGDIKGCFDNINHTILMTILREKILDNRFLRLLEGLLKAGYCEEWEYYPTHSGTPQGGIVSPILANIYMDRLDQYADYTLIPAYTRGLRRPANAVYRSLLDQSRQAWKSGDLERAKRLRRQAQELPSVDLQSQDYQRLRYIRYADDFLLGFVGPKKEAEEIKEKLAQFLKTELELTMAEEKTLITHAETGRARFLGYEIGIMMSQTKFDVHKVRRINGNIGLYIPKDVILSKRKRYMRDGKVIHLRERTNDTEFGIITRYQAEYRGLVEYYAKAQNLFTLAYVRYTMETSLLKTLANKGKTTIGKIQSRLSSTTKTAQGPRKCLKLTIPREGKKPLVAIFGGISLKKRKDAFMQDQVIKPYVSMRSEAIDKLLQDTCEVCGSQENVVMHHVRHLADLKKKGRKEVPFWMKVMISRQRKRIAVCHKCHNDIHFNRPKS